MDKEKNVQGKDGVGGKKRNNRLIGKLILSRYLLVNIFLKKFSCFCIFDF